ncbi:MAG: RluA family pseudouridine synthase, partial [Firmicutes bacterium]|nr:RluA family pseudouridine synthase [Bacillota bacterium]
MIEIRINENDGGQRLDRFLRKYLPGSPLSLVYKMIRKDVKVNGKRCPKETMLEAGDVIALYIPEEKLAELGRKKRTAHARKTFGVAYEDSDVLIAEKPYGILT